MRQKGFATVFGLCMILIITLIVKGIQEAETNHAREVLNFEMEQVLQHAAESGIIEAVKSNSATNLKLTKYFKHDEQTIKITVDIPKPLEKFNGKYYTSCATAKSNFFGKKIYRRAYAYVLNDDTTIHFLELPSVGD